VQPLGHAPRQVAAELLAEDAILTPKDLILIGLFERLALKGGDEADGYADVLSPVDAEVLLEVHVTGQALVVPAV
jgi:hypothetical protein